MFAEEPVNINASQLDSRCHEGELLWVGPEGRIIGEGPELTDLGLDNDGNAFVVALGGESCAAGSSLVEASLENAPYTTYTTDFNILPPEPTFPEPPGLTSRGGPVGKDQQDTVATGPRGHPRGPRFGRAVGSGRGQPRPAALDGAAGGPRRRRADRLGARAGREAPEHAEVPAARRRRSPSEPAGPGFTLAAWLTIGEPAAGRAGGTGAEHVGRGVWCSAL